MSKSGKHSIFSRGFNLIEAAIVLAVVGLVIGGIWLAAASVSENRKQARTMEQILVIGENLKRRFPVGTVFQCMGGSASCTTGAYSLVDSVAANYIPKSGWDGLVPADMITGSTNPVDPWGNPVTARIAASGARAMGYSMLVKPATCASMAPKIAAMLARHNVTVTVYGSDGLNGSATTPELAAGICYSVGRMDGDLVTLTIAYDR